MKRRTYWHLEGLGKKPNDYDIASSRLLYYLERGFEVDVPLSSWYEKHQRGSLLQCSDWERFRDPRETTYTKYTEIQRTKEAFVDGLIRSGEELGQDARLAPEYRDATARVLGALRFPVHGLQMIASYVGHMAPSGRIVIASLFQAADEVRRIQRIAYRLAELMKQGAPGDGREDWQRDPAWQPLREVIERLLVTYDWGEAFIVASFVLKPRFDELFMVHYGRAAIAAGDDLLGKMFHSLYEDCTWHGDYSRAIVRVAIADRPENAAIAREIVARWSPLAERAVAALSPLLPGGAVEQVEATVAKRLEDAGLGAGESLNG